MVGGLGSPMTTLSIGLDSITPLFTAQLKNARKARKDAATEACLTRLSSYIYLTYSSLIKSPVIVLKRVFRRLSSMVCINFDNSTSYYFIVYGLRSRIFKSRKKACIFSAKSSSNKSTSGASVLTYFLRRLDIIKHLRFCDINRFDGGLLYIRLNRVVLNRLYASVLPCLTTDKPRRYGVCQVAESEGFEPSRP